MLKDNWVPEHAGPPSRLEIKKKALLFPLDVILDYFINVSQKYGSEKWQIRFHVHESILAHT